MLKSVTYTSALVVAGLAPSLCLAAGGAAPGAAPGAAKNATRPNVLLIQADDLGFDDLGINGQKVIRTPALDALGASAVRFTNFYLHSVSSPSRASLLTGRHFWRTGVSGMHGGRDFMNLDEVTIAEIFRRAGYATAMWGKWHSGKTDGYFPWQRGFDEAFMANLYQHANPSGTVNGRPVSFPGKWGDGVCTDMAIDFIAKHKDSPFFAYVPYMSPHGIWDAPKEYIEHYTSQGYSKYFSTLCGQIEHLSFQIGRLLDAVHRMGLDENTIVIFMSDNGPIGNVGEDIALTDHEWELRNPNAARGSKGTNWKNGIHSPLFMRWGGHFPAGDNPTFVSICDMLPTLAQLCGVEIPAAGAGVVGGVGSAGGAERVWGKKLDGSSFAGMIDPTVAATASEEALTRNDIYIAQWYPIFGKGSSEKQAGFIPLNEETRAQIEFENQAIGLQRGYYKLLLNQKGDDPVSLRDLRDDPHESRNLASEKPEMVAEMTALLRQWFDGIMRDESFHMPIFQIGLNGARENQVLAYAPLRIAKGMTNSQHDLGGWAHSGDFAEYRIMVHTPGVYSASVQLKSKIASETSGSPVKVTVSCTGAGTGAGSGSVATLDLADPKASASLRLPSGEQTLRVELNGDPQKAFSMTNIQLNFDKK